MRKVTFILVFAFSAVVTGHLRAQAVKQKPLVIETQGSFAVGGAVISNPGTFDPIKRTADGQTFHGDHAYVFYQIPVKAKKLPLVFWHGIGQFSKTWETTPDGREGYQNIFLRRGFGVYLLDQPRRGDAVNRNGGNVTVIHLPEVGIKGNTHFPFSDLNNIEVADLMSKWLKKERLDK